MVTTPVFTPPIDPAQAPDGLACLPGFGPGAQVMTDAGEVPVEWLATGDRVLTRDHGPQPVLWIGHIRLAREHLMRHPGFAPYEIAAGALGPGRPGHPTVLAPRTRVMLAGWEVELHSGAHEALAEIGDLARDAVVTRPPLAAGTQYTYLLLAMHAVVQVNGLWAETLLLDHATRGALAEILPPGFADAPALEAGHAQAARLCLAGWEVAAILGDVARAVPQVIDRVA
jgi:Hint domain